MQFSQQPDFKITKTRVNFQTQGQSKRHMEFGAKPVPLRGGVRGRREQEVEGTK